MEFRIDFTNFGVNNRECFTLKLGMLETSAFSLPFDILGRT